MVIAVSDYFVELLRDEGIINEQDVEWYSYGFQITIANMVNGLIVLLIAVFSHFVLDMLLFYLMFVSLRFYCGGYHADSYKKCFCLFALTGILALGIRCAALYLEVTEGFCLASILLQALCIYRWAPIDNENRPASLAEKAHFQKCCWLVYLFWLAVGAMLAVLKQGGLIGIYSATLTLVSMFMLIEVKKQKGKCYENKKSIA